MMVATSRIVFIYIEIKPGRQEQAWVDVHRDRV